jgi:hypothetical protein
MKKKNTNTFQNIRVRCHCAGTCSGGENVGEFMRVYITPANLGFKALRHHST